MLRTKSPAAMTSIRAAWLLMAVSIAACTAVTPVSPTPTTPAATTSQATPTPVPATPPVTATPPSSITSSPTPSTAAPTQSPAPRLVAPEGLALGPDGRIYVSDFSANRVFRIDAGTLTVVAGNGQSVFEGEGGSALETGLAAPAGIVWDPSGNLYIAIHHGDRVLRVDNAGVITTVAGTGVGNRGGSLAPNFGGDGGPATAAQLGGPIGLALDAAGNLYIADTFNHRIRRVDTAGVITTVAGSGTRIGSELSGAGELATDAALGDPFYVTVAPGGDVYWAEAPNSRVFRLDSAGILHHVAGTGRSGYSGDGGLATEAQLQWPNGIAVTDDGTVYVSEGDGGHRIRRIDPSGVIATYAGTGVAGFSGDGGPAAEAQLNGPFGLVLDAADNLYVADGGNRRVRRIDAAGVITTIAGP